MYSVLSGDLEHAAEHDRQLASGEPLVMRAELVVARIIFELLVRRVFVSVEDAGVEVFAARLPLTSIVDEGEMEAVIRAALVGDPIPYRGMEADRLFTVWMVVSGIIVRGEGLGTAAIGDLVRRGEREAGVRGIRLARAHQS
jgi:hypothetical protein